MNLLFLVNTPVGDGNDEVNVKQKEENIMELGRLLSAARKPEGDILCYLNRLKIC